MRRYENIGLFYTLKDEKRITRKRSVTIPIFEPSDQDVYIITQVGDRLDILSSEYYNDQTMWWIIATVNNVGKGTFIVEPGIQLRIPNPNAVRELISLYNKENK